MTCTRRVLEKGSGPGEGSWGPVGAGFPGLCCRLLALTAPGHRGCTQAVPGTRPRVRTPAQTLRLDPHADRSVWAEAAGTVPGAGADPGAAGVPTELRRPRGTGNRGSGWS